MEMRLNYILRLQEDILRYHFSKYRGLTVHVAMFVWGLLSWVYGIMCRV